MRAGIGLIAGPSWQKLSFGLMACVCGVHSVGGTGDLEESRDLNCYQTFISEKTSHDGETESPM